MTAICIIPARSGSKRLPRKNVKMFNGAPIISYPIKAALNSGLFSKVIVSSDDESILAIAKQNGGHIINRPPELCTDQSSEIDAYLHVLNSMEEKPHYFCAIYPCAAFVTPGEIKDALQHMIDTDADACMGVTKYDIHPFQMLSKEDDFYRLRFPAANEQTPYPPAYASNGSLYWFRTESFLKNQTYFPERLSIYETVNIDINTSSDFAKAEAAWINRS